MTKLRLLLIAVIMVLGGGLLASVTQTAGGTVEIRDVRFMGTNGTMMSGLLYVPNGVTAENPAPGVLAVHGYINSRETQSPFAIEYARRGFVTLALDQSGHGYSDPPAFANGFGGPDGLAYLRSLDIVDTDNIALTGHSMGGWAVLVAAGIFPDDYKSVLIEGSSTGTFGAPEGTAEFPRNFGLVFSTWDEFSAFMWGAETATQIQETDKLKAAFGTDETVVVGELYGSVEDGTARKLYQPVTTHPGDHLNAEAVGNAIDWVQTTLDGEQELPPSDQIWHWKEIGTFIALLGAVLAMFPLGGLLLETPFFSHLVNPLPEAKPITVPGRYIAYAVAIVVPILTYFWLNNNGPTWFPAGTFWPQQITTGIVVWALGNAAISLVLFLAWHFGVNRSTGATPENYGLSASVSQIVGSILLAACVVFFVYLLLAISDFFFKTDFRIWVVAVKLMNVLHFQMFLAYLPFFALFFLVSSTVLNGQLREVTPDGQPVTFARAALAKVGLLVLGFIGLLLIQYIPLMAGGPLPLAEPLLSIVAFQFVPLLTIAGLLMTYYFYQTGRVYVGAFIAAMFITWVIVAGQATQFAF